MLSNPTTALPLILSSLHLSKSNSYLSLYHLSSIYLASILISFKSFQQALHHIKSILKQVFVNGHGFVIGHACLVYARCCFSNLSKAEMKEKDKLKPIIEILEKGLQCM